MSHIKLVNQGTPDTPAVGRTELFVGDDGKLKRVDSDGDVTTVEGGGAEARFVAASGNLTAGPGQATENSISFFERVPVGVDPDTGAPQFGGVVRLVTSLPVVVGGGDAVMAGLNATAESIPACTDGWDLQGFVMVSSLDGAQVLQVVDFVVIPSGDVGESLDWNDASVTAVAGTDLSWDPDQHTVTSAAGGTFTVLLRVNQGWD